MRSITFYSYKGGVGRSLALTHIAERLSELNQSIFLIDFDLEAPGLHYKFDKQIKKAISLRGVKKGLVDYLYEFLVENDKMKLPDNFEDFYYELEFDSIYKKGKVYLMTVGDVTTDDYWLKLSKLDWKADFFSGSRAGIELLLDLKGRILKYLSPNYLLIDSRTGITDVATLTLRILSDAIVLLCINNSESIDGTLAILKTINSQENLWQGKPKKVVLALSRVPRIVRKNDTVREVKLIERFQAKFRNFITSQNEVVVLHEDNELLWEENSLFEGQYETHLALKDDYFKLLSSILVEFADEGQNVSQLIQEIKNREKSDSLIEKAWSVYSKSKNIDRAISLLNEASRINENDVNIYSLRGWIYADGNKKSDLDNAIKDYLTTIRIEPNTSYWHHNLGNLYLRKKETNSARKHFKKSIDLNPKESFSFAGLGFIYYGNSEWKKALRYFSKSVTLAPDYNVIYFYRGICFENLKEHEKAIQDFTTHLGFEKKDTLALLYRADCFAELKKFTNAVVDYEKALKLSPKNIDIYNGLADTYRRMGQFEKGLRIAKRALVLNKTDKFVFANIAEIYAAQRQDAKFYFYLEKALKAGFKIEEYIHDRIYLRYRFRAKFQLLLKRYKNNNQGSEDSGN